MQIQKQDIMSYNSINLDNLIFCKPVFNHENDTYLSKVKFHHENDNKSRFLIQSPKLQIQSDIIYSKNQEIMYFYSTIG